METKTYFVPARDCRCDRFLLSARARHRRKVIERIELMLAALAGIGIYVLTGLALRWFGVA